uniref:Secreted protein n=1 Tax=Ixodes ricinus TaxID=34613 RepID=V5H8E5_IXORI
MPNLGVSLFTGWLVFAYWGWLQIATNDKFVPKENRHTPPHTIVMNYVTSRFNKKGSCQGGRRRDQKSETAPV